MKKYSIIFIIRLILSGCSSATVKPTATSVTTTPTITATLAPSPTSTAQPTLTLTPSLPTTIEITADSGVNEQVSSFVEKTVNQAYWFYVGLGCSPDGFKVRITNYESGETRGPSGFITGWANSETEPKMGIRISHETAHTMCQLAFSKSSNMGAIDVIWLTEGVANYFSAMERIANSGNINGIAQSSIEDHTLGMANWISQNFCNTPLSSLESPNADRILQDFAGVGDVATRLLVKTNPNGVKAIMNYYGLLANMPNSKAFEMAFGTTKQEFYKQFQNECNTGFPTFNGGLESVRIQGNVILKNTTQPYNHYAIVFCNAKIKNCVPQAEIRKDGSFFQNLTPGNYTISINPSAGGELIGWYFSYGLVSDGTCAQIIDIQNNQNITITIDFLYIATCTTINGFPAISSSDPSIPDTSTPIGEGCVSESSKVKNLSIHCLGRMSKDLLPTALQEREIVYGFEVTGIDLSTLGSELNKVITHPKNFLLSIDGNKLYVIVPQNTPSNDYFVNITLKDGSFASAIYHWKSKSVGIQN